MYSPPAALYFVTRGLVLVQSIGLHIFRAAPSLRQQRGGQGGEYMLNSGKELTQRGTEKAQRSQSSERLIYHT